MIPVQVDATDATPLHQQVAAEIRRAIADGEAEPGERLPPARDLAAVLGVNHNTVLRSLRELRDEGLLEFRRGRGITVVGAAPQRSAVIAMARELVHFARQQGYRRSELVQIIEGLS
ncbi:MAG TPA: GntR family transcriptional regulator [Acidimicrobiales bacterium]|jgi:GntR family transcriptional regulator|nr:GntR family transcriptional regulator [Acidimicrobiales bacterium]